MNDVVSPVAANRGQDTMDYNASHITVLRGLEAVRERPAMYIGATGTVGLHHLVFELVQNSIDEAMAGHCTTVDVTLYEDGSCEVRDNGRGIPVEPHSEVGVPACELVMMTLHAGAKFGRKAYSVSGGLHGVGLSCVNALSEWLELEVCRSELKWRQTFARGQVTSPLTNQGTATGHGTSIRFLADSEIFGDAQLEFTELARRLQEHAFLWPGVTTRIRCIASGRQEEYLYRTGLVGFVKHLNATREVLHPEPVVVSARVGDISVEAAMQWTAAYTEDISTYANGILTPRGGTHFEGLCSALTRVVSTYAAEHGLLHIDSNEKIAGYDIREGLTCVAAVTLPSPQFEGQSKSSLSSGEARLAVEHSVAEVLAKHFQRFPSTAAAIVGKALEASRARAAARRASERARYRSADATFSKEVYQHQFGIRSKNWHDSAKWITHKELLATHAALCKVPQDSKVLDVCCGSGVVGEAFRDRVGSITGLDLTPEMVSLARTRLDVVHQGDAYAMPFEDNAFDLVVNREVLHLLPRPEKVLSEVVRVLRPGGQFIVGQLVPFGAADAPWLFRLLKKKQPLFFNNLTEESMTELLLDAGLREIEVKECLQWEDIDIWIDTFETASLNRHEIRDLYHHAPAEVRAVHPFEITSTGRIRDCWRWCVFSAIKPAELAANSQPRVAS